MRGAGGHRTGHSPASWDSRAWAPSSPMGQSQGGQREQTWVPGSPSPSHSADADVTSVEGTRQESEVWPPACLTGDLLQSLSVLILTPQAASLPSGLGDHSDTQKAA